MGTKDDFSDDETSSQPTRTAGRTKPMPPHALEVGNGGSQLSTGDTGNRETEPSYVPESHGDPAAVASHPASADGHNFFRAPVEEERRTARRGRPLASLAGRPVAMRSRGSFRGTIINPRDDREMHYESSLERNAAFILLADPRVARLCEQVGPVAFKASDDVERNHFFDFVATLRDGTEHAISVKYEADVEKSGIRGTLDSIRRSGSVKSNVLLRTDRHITRDRAVNARLILHANRVADAREVTVLRSFLARLHGVAPLSHILRAAGLDSPEGFYAAVRLFGLGLIRCVDGGTFNHDSRICNSNLQAK
ncbi:hypothetical protein PZ895_13970 [Mesorhizobium sp. YIM 152430]|uniref:hypothetical protein n=1 Tax=Mesorhizobium sp. YIM 152430 TaxID=3031761 RepID=UPI0023DA4332|nr:hypothetical protein [Mesorhizobium sp. YIM 152430]MDF1600871.1 hypothetical protein [Mesorhizobium sp. YIM 152430]